jgi:hypothetical protein
MRWLCLVLAATGCKVKDPPPVTEEWKDGFDRDDLGGDYFATGRGYEVAEGALSAKGAHNHPLWLRKKLPRDVRIDLDCWSNEERGDIKVEIFGDGRSYDPDGNQYMATAYVLVLGAWFNSKSVIVRLDEHGKDIVQNTTLKVQPTRHYHWRIERTDKKLAWYVDDMQKPFLVFDDPSPLEGPGHEYFGFNNWETDTWFDNLVITPL